MKAATVSLATLLIGCALHVPARATTPTEAALARGEKNYLACLASDNEGVLESAIAGVIRLRLLAPDRPMVVLERKLDDLAANGPSPAVCFKAYLAGAILDNPRLVPDAVAASSATNDELFSLIASRLQETLLSYSKR